mmetsp:Transcript_10309/g.21196  ORF Transcript_10309/g.21196 Transcript_10309/m.21196 type:complete len:337 (+) Transcript_10309:218-1228(+)|eukprot:CAMPEP_0118640620 /NCGR_PEP_ID=MMETSP0785-20121206/4850_1 /TAXON_ID=91992 /ORGANISM="Bolidomonas pacifica, Strain CCMP 1866" /LENGTH=336 /DNA_ID=CAMNT_0006532019 /DNA_START=164 /DNA_END=1174 /DNA_ORIENTATION=+
MSNSLVVETDPDLDTVLDGVSEVWWRPVGDTHYMQFGYFEAIVERAKIHCQVVVKAGYFEGNVVSLLFLEPQGRKNDIYNVILLWTQKDFRMRGFASQLLKSFVNGITSQTPPAQLENIHIHSGPNPTSASKQFYIKLKFDKPKRSASTKYTSNVSKLINVIDYRSRQRASSTQSLMPPSLEAEEPSPRKGLGGRNLRPRATVLDYTDSDDLPENWNFHATLPAWGRSTQNEKVAESREEEDGGGYVVQPRGRPPKDKMWDTGVGEWMPKEPINKSRRASKRKRSETSFFSPPVFSSPPESLAEEASDFFRRKPGRPPKGMEWDETVGKYVIYLLD